jgi:hypothetical protein
MSDSPTALHFAGTVKEEPSQESLDRSRVVPPPSPGKSLRQSLVRNTPKNHPLLLQSLNSNPEHQRSMSSNNEDPPGSANQAALTSARLGVTVTHHTNSKEDHEVAQVTQGRYSRRVSPENQLGSRGHTSELRKAACSRAHSHNRNAPNAAFKQKI